MPVDCGPLKPLPPLNATKSAPKLVNFIKFSIGGNKAAASTITGMLFL